MSDEEAYNRKHSGVSPEEFEKFLKAADEVWEEHLRSGRRTGKGAVIKHTSPLGRIHCLIDPRPSIVVTLLKAWGVTDTLSDDDNLSAKEQKEWNIIATILVARVVTKYSLKLFEEMLPLMLKWSFSISHYLHLPIFLAEGSHKSEITEGKNATYIRRQAEISAIERTRKEGIEKFSGELARIALATAKEIQNDFGLLVLDIYNRTLKVCQQVKRKAKPFSETRERKSTKASNLGEWETVYNTIELDLPPGIQLHPHNFLTKRANEIALSAVAEFLCVPETTLKTQILPRLRKLEG